MLDLFGYTVFLERFQNNRFVDIGDTQHANSFFKHRFSHNLWHYFLLCGCRTTVKMAPLLDSISWPFAWLQASGWKSYCLQWLLRPLCSHAVFRCMNSRPSCSRTWRSCTYLLQYLMSFLIFLRLDCHYGARLEILNHPITVLILFTSGRTMSGFDIFKFGIYRFDETIRRSNQSIY